jgi:molecular chaperone DnaK
MRGVLVLGACVALLVGCREQNTEPPTGYEIKPPRSAAKLSPDGGISAPQANLMGTVVDGVVSSPRGGVSQKLFADDVAAGTLPLSISIETIGGIATVIIPRGTKLPTSRTEVFSTALDDQNRVEVHLLQGERPLVTQNRTLGKFQLFGIPPAPRGVPQIEVTFTVDKDGVLAVSARDKATDRVQAIQIDGLAGATLDKAAVDQILAEAQAAQAQDAQASALANARNDLETLIYADKNLLKDVGHKLSAKTRTRFERELKGAEQVLKTATRLGDLKLVLAVKDSLGKAGHDAAAELYANAK